MPHAESPPPAAEHQPTALSSLPPLYVNDGLLDPADIGTLRPSYPDECLETLRQRYAEDGYIFMKGVLPRADVLKAREDYFSFLSPTGVLEPNTTTVDGIFNSNRSKDDFPGIGTHVAGDNPHLPFVQLAMTAHSQPWYTESLCKHPDLLSFVARFTSWGPGKTLGFKRTILRNNIPGAKAIGVHYDQIFLRHGDPDSVTAWVPIGDVAVDGGGLIYLDKAHNLGRDVERDFFAQAKEKGMSDDEAKHAFNSNMASNGMLDEGGGPAAYGKRFGRKWLVTNYEAGDVVFHDAFSIHASTVNYDKQGKIRVGTDIRFVDKTGNWDTRWGEDFFRLDDGL